MSSKSLTFSAGCGSNCGYTMSSVHIRNSELGPDVVQTPQKLTACFLGWHGIEGTHHCKDSIQTGWDITGNVTSKTCCSWLGCEICFPDREIKSPIDGCLCTQLFSLAFIFLPERGVNIQLVSTAGVPLRSRKKCH